jgi:hypothetical protein
VTEVASQAGRQGGLLPRLTACAASPGEPVLTQPVPALKTWGWAVLLIRRAWGAAGKQRRIYDMHGHHFID